MPTKKGYRGIFFGMILFAVFCAMMASSLLSKTGSVIPAQSAPSITGALFSCRKLFFVLL